MAARRQKKFKKMKMPPMIQGVYDAIMGKMSVIVVSVIVILLAAALFRAFIYRSDYFRLRAIELKGAFIDQRITQSITAELFRVYKGKSVFEVNLKGVHKYLQMSYPDASDIAVTIDLPDKLGVTLKFRKPVALVGTIYAQYPIDEDGYVLPRADAKQIKNLPVILGVDIKGEEKRSRDSRSKNLGLALDFIKIVKRFKFINDIGVLTVDVRDVHNLIFIMRNGIEVRMGSEDFLKRLDLLEKTIRNPRVLINNVKYIDVRFKDVVVAPK